MIKNISSARAEYLSTYRALRLHGGWPEEERHVTYFTEIQDCALLSYDYHDSHFDGWINRNRMAAFERRSRAIENWRGAIPF